MNNNDLSSLYNIRFAKNQLFRKNEIWRVICKVFLNRFVKQSDVVVDVACGYGEFINNISAQKKIAIDLNPNTKAYLKPEIEFHECKATELSSVILGAADVIFTSNFLEHLPDKETLELFLDQVLMALKPGGIYLILGPNLRYLPGKY